MLFNTHLLLLLQPSVLWLSIVTFNNDAKPTPKWFLLEFDVPRNRPWLGGLPHLETFMVKFHHGREDYPVSRLGGSPHYHVNVIKLNWEIVRTGGLTHLNGLPHLPKWGECTCAWLFSCLARFDRRTKKKGQLLVVFFFPQDWRRSIKRSWLVLF